MRFLQGIFPFFFPLLLLFSAWGWGRSALAKFRFAHASDALGIPCLIGLGVMGMLLGFAGVAGFFYQAILWAILLVGLGLALGMRSSLRTFFPVPFSGGIKCVFSLMFLALAGVIAGTVLLRLNLPPIVTDELSYHLWLPKIYLVKHAVFYSPYHVNSAFPLLTEMLYAYGISLDHAFAIKGVHFIFGILACVGLYSLSRETLKGGPSRGAALLFLSVPAVFHQMALAKNDLALTAFLTASYLALFQGWRERGLRWFLLAGALSGFAMGVKYLAVFAVAVQGLLLLTDFWLERKSGRGSLKPLVFFAFPLLIVASPWYLRTYLHTGNPVYPYLTHFWGGEGLENPLSLGSKGFGKGVVDFLLLPWRMTFHPEAFGGMSNQWGPVFLGFLPGLLFFREKGRKGGFLLAIALLTTFVWFLTKQNLRFLLPALPFFCLLAMSVLGGVRERKGILGRALALGFLGLIALHTAIAVYQLRSVYRVALGREAKDVFLAGQVPVYPVADFLNRRFPEGDFKLLSQEHRAYYFNGDVVRERAYRRLTDYPRLYEGREEEFYEKLREEGLTHLLLKKGPGAEPVPFLDDFAGTLQGSGSFGALIFKHFAEDPDSQSQTSYFLYEFSPPSPPKNPGPH